jgi:hypothetical protein
MLTNIKMIRGVEGFCCIVVPLAAPASREFAAAVVADHCTAQLALTLQCARDKVLYRRDCAALAGVRGGSIRSLQAQS